LLFVRSLLPRPNQHLLLSSIDIATFVIIIVFVAAAAIIPVNINVAGPLKKKMVGRRHRLAPLLCPGAPGRLSGGWGEELVVGGRAPLSAVGAVTAERSV